MKQYRFQCYVAGLYITSVVNADNDENAINGFVQNLNDNQYSVKPDGFGRGMRRFHITYEELDNGTTGVDIKEATAGVQVGNPSISAG
tara:strand:+ start:167 stop:430 length:264 start_codon:yes stop_codon:yes gene_type:complete